jgi:hypothetical protein
MYNIFIYVIVKKKPIQAGRRNKNKVNSELRMESRQELDDDLGNHQYGEKVSDNKSLELVDDALVPQGDN